jgi:transcriptional regulator with GAF, ATPase, and Fis domain
MPDEKFMSNDDIGELKFDLTSDINTDDDVKFELIIKNLLVLIRDFYGADSCAVYWFNKFKNNVKLLTSSQDGQWNNFEDKYKIGNDILSLACLKNSQVIYDDVSQMKNDALVCFKNASNVKSVIINPLEIDGDVCSVVLCESKTENFFGNPNLYSLSVFSECIINYIRYYSLKEDFDFQNRLLSKFTHDYIYERREIFKVILDAINRFIITSQCTFILYEDGSLKLTDVFGENADSILNEEFNIEKNSIAGKAASGDKILIHKFTKEDSYYRYSPKESLKTGTFFCSIPFSIKNNLIGVISFDTNEDVYKKQKELLNLVKLITLFLYSYKLNGLIGYQYLEEKDKTFNLYNKKFFDKRVDSEINKCRIFNNNDLIVVYSRIDNADSFLGNGIGISDILKLYISELRKELKDYDMIFMLENNLLGVILNSEKDENVLIEFEKIRKLISTKIYSIKGKEINFTVSLAIKKYNDLSVEQDTFLGDLFNMLETSVREGGNKVKF